MDNKNKLEDEKLVEVSGGDGGTRVTDIKYNNVFKSKTSNRYARVMTPPYLDTGDVSFYVGEMKPDGLIHRRGSTFKSYETYYDFKEIYDTTELIDSDLWTNRSY